MNLNPFSAFKDKVKGDIIKFAKENFDKLKDQVLAAAEVIDADENGIVDKQQLHEDIDLVVDGSKGLLDAALVNGKKVWKGLSGIAKLGMVYYVKFGPKKPTELAALRQENNVA